MLVSSLSDYYVIYLSNMMMIRSIWLIWIVELVVSKCLVNFSRHVVATVSHLFELDIKAVEDED